MRKIAEDPRISAAHVSVFVGLWKLWIEYGNQYSLTFVCQEVKGLSKISSNSTFHKRIRELHNYGYIEYFPSFNHYQGSQVNFMED